MQRSREWPKTGNDGGLLQTNLRIENTEKKCNYEALQGSCHVSNYCLENIVIT